MIKVIGTGKNYSNNLIDSLLSFNTTSTWSVSSGTGSAVCSTDYAFDGVQSLKLNSTTLGSTFIATNSVQSSIIPRDGVYGLVVSIRKDHRLQPITLKVNIYKNAVLEYGSEFTIGNALDSSLDDNDIWVRFMTDVDLSLSATDEITMTFEQKSMTSALTETTVYIDGIHLYAKDNVDTLAPLYISPDRNLSDYMLKPSLNRDATVTGTKDVDWNYVTNEFTLTGDTIFSDINYPSNPETISIHLTGAFVPTFPVNWSIAGVGDYDGTVWNILALDYYNDGTSDIVRGTLTPII